MTYDTIIIGAGHNGLVAAAVLAAKGRKVCVLEQSGRVGGMAQGGVIAGQSIDRLAHGLWGMHPDIAKELGLSDADLGPVTPTVVLSSDEKHAVLDGAKAYFADDSLHPQSGTYGALIRDLRDFAALLAPLSKSTPPGAPVFGLMAKGGMLASHLKLGLKLRLLGKARMREMLRIVLSNVSDYALDHLPDGPLAGALAVDAVKGTWSGPRSPGSVLSLMYRLSAGGAFRRPPGGMAGLCDRLAETLRARSGELRTGTRVIGITIDDDAVTGVRLADGSALMAPMVLSSCGALVTSQMAGLSHFDAEDVRRLRNIRCKGTAAKLNLALSGPVLFTGLPDNLAGARLLIAPDATYVERAFNAAKYGRISPEPMLEILLGSDRKTMSVIFHYAPYHLDGGWDEVARGRLLQITLDTLAPYAPGLPELVDESDVLSPVDIADLTGAPGGHWHHGEWSTDQILTNRPFNGAGHYQLKINGLYLCGAGAHPGGDVTGLPGRNAALQALRDGGRS